MANTILIYLPESSWIIFNEQGEVLDQVKQGDLALLTSEALTHHIIAVVPQTEVLLTQVQLPKLPKNKILQTLPFAMEDQLLADIANLHFAIGPYVPNELLSVAVVNKANMERWLQQLSQHHLIPTALIPMAFTLPFTAETWHAIVYDDLLTVRTGTHSGFSGDKENLLTLIELKLAEVPLPPKAIHLLDYSNTLNKVALGNKITHKASLPENFLKERLIPTAETTINLLQGAYQTKHNTQKAKKIWLAACYLSVAAISILFFTHLVSFFILNHEESKLQTAINQIYHKNFPNAASVVAPKQRMAEKLNNLTNIGQRNRLLVWLSHIGESLPSAQGIHINEMTYHPGQLILQITAPNFESVANFSEALSQYGLVIKQQNTAALGTQVKSALLISQGNSV